MLVQPLIYVFLWLIVTAFSIFIQIITTRSVLKWNNENVTGRYDYIIVGGGSAGSVLAGRLSENPNVSVLVIEAGGEGHDLLNIPVLGPLKQLSAVDWQYVTVPQKHACFGLKNNVSRWPSGKILGGSSHLNYMIYHRGHKKDYLTWKDPDSKHWDYDDIQYYFDKAEKDSERNHDSSNEDSASINVRNSLHSTELSDAILHAAKELGHEIHKTGFKSGTGFTKPKLHITKEGMRWTSDQFIREARNRKNIHVMTNAVVEEILFIDGFEAYGVKIKNHGCGKEIIHANFEIIVSAGSIGSPKLLMLSGIGPSPVLISANIPRKIDLPVGKNLQDHVTTGLDLGILEKHLFSFVDLMAPSSAIDYFVSGKGPFTSGLVDAIGIIHSSLVDSERSRPDLQLMVMMAGVSSDKGVFFRYSMGISQKTWNDYFYGLTNESVISLLPVLLHPKSSGEITLDPENPKGMPKIDPNYLSNEADVTTLVEGIKIIRELMGTKTLKKFGLRFNDKSLPGCGAWKFGSHEYWRCYVRHLTLTVYHPVGTCKMAKLKDGGVVDYRLRVHGTNKLRVIDASVMPTLPSANPMAGVIMIAEKGADMIKEDFRGRLSTCRNVNIFLRPRTCS